MGKLHVSYYLISAVFFVALNHVHWSRVEKPLCRKLGDVVIICFLKHLITDTRNGFTEWCLIKLVIQNHRCLAAQNGSVNSFQPSCLACFENMENWLNGTENTGLQYFIACLVGKLKFVLNSTHSIAADLPERRQGDLEKRWNRLDVLAFIHVIFYKKPVYKKPRIRHPKS